MLEGAGSGVPAFGAMAAAKDGTSGTVLVRLPGAFLPGVRGLRARGKQGLIKRPLAVPIGAQSRERHSGGGLRRAGAQGARRALMALVTPNLVFVKQIVFVEGVRWQHWMMVP